MRFVFAATLMAAAATPARAEVYAGVYYSAFEVSAFEPCGVAERWWLETTGAAGPGFWKRVRDVEKSVTDVNAGGPVPVFMAIAGDLSPKGAYGHLGAYPRRITVSSASEIRAASAAEIAECADSPEAKAMR